MRTAAQDYRPHDQRDMQTECLTRSFCQSKAQARHGHQPDP